MPTHLDPAFIEPSPVAPVERDTETGDLFAQPVEEPETTPEPDVEALRRRLVSLAKELLLRHGGHGITTGDLRYSAENRGLLTGHESLAFMNALQLGKVIREAGGFATGEHRRSRVASAKRSLNAVYTTREFVPAHPVHAEQQGRRSA